LKCIFDVRIRGSDKNRAYVRYTVIVQIVYSAQYTRFRAIAAVNINNNFLGVVISCSPSDVRRVPPKKKNLANFYQTT
jgi:hypothetical protein